MPSTMDIEILEDGTISVTSGDIGDTQHLSADEFLNDLEDMSGGEKTTTKREHPFMKNKRVLRGGKILHNKA